MLTSCRESSSLFHALMCYRPVSTDSPGPWREGGGPAAKPGKEIQRDVLTTYQSWSSALTNSLRFKLKDHALISWPILPWLFCYQYLLPPAKKEKRNPESASLGQDAAQEIPCSLRAWLSASSVTDIHSECHRNLLYKPTQLQCH